MLARSSNALELKRRLIKLTQDERARYISIAERRVDSQKLFVIPSTPIVDRVPLYQACSFKFFVLADWESSSQPHFLSSH